MTSAARRPIPFPNRTFDHVPIRPLRMPSLVHLSPRRAPADQKLVERVRREFSDMRGLSPTMAQAMRLFHLADEEFRGIFAQLLQERFLVLCSDNRYRLRPRSIRRHV